MDRRKTLSAVKIFWTSPSNIQRAATVFTYVWNEACEQHKYTFWGERVPQGWGNLWKGPAVAGCQSYLWLRWYPEWGLVGRLSFGNRCSYRYSALKLLRTWIVLRDIKIINVTVVALVPWVSLHPMSSFGSLVISDNPCGQLHIKHITVMPSKKCLRQAWYLQCLSFPTVGAVVKSA